MSLLNDDSTIVQRAQQAIGGGIKVTRFDDGAMGILDLDSGSERTAMHLSPAKAAQLCAFILAWTHPPVFTPDGVNFVSDGRTERQAGPDTKASNPKDAIGTRKAPMSTVPIRVIAELGVAMLEGAAKYGRHNYRAVGVRASVYFDACMRHLFAWFEGEDYDADSGLSHVTKAIASLVVLRDSMMQGNWVDDRAPSTPPFYAFLNARADEVIDRHADKDPRHYTIADTCSPR